MQQTATENIITLLPLKYPVSWVQSLVQSNTSLASLYPNMLVDDLTISNTVSNWLTDGLPLIAYAIHMRDMPLLRWCVTQGADVNRVPDAWYPLLQMTCDPQIVQCLLENGARAFGIKNARYNSVLDSVWCEAIDNETCLTLTKLLLEHGAVVDVDCDLIRGVLLFTECDDNVEFNFRCQYLTLVMSFVAEYDPSLAQLELGKLQGTFIMHPEWATFFHDFVETQASRQDYVLK